MQLFTPLQIKRFSNIFDNAGQVFLGSLVIGPIVSPSAFKDLIPVMSAGISLTFFLWWVSLRLERISS
jgi:hypothetical protein